MGGSCLGARFAKEGTLGLLPSQLELSWFWNSHVDNDDNDYDYDGDHYCDDDDNDSNDDNYDDVDNADVDL